MKRTINHIRAYTAAILAIPFIVIVLLISFLSLMLFAIAMALVKIPQFMFWLLGPRPKTDDELRLYHNGLVRILQRIVDCADWPNR